MIHFKIYKSVSELPMAWDGLPTGDVFLKTPFLKALALSGPENIETNYVAIYKDDILAGITIIQRVELYLDNVFRNTSDKALKRLTKRVIAKVVKGNTLIVGNLMHTGQHGLYYNSKIISQTSYLETIFEAIDFLAIEIKKAYNKTVRMVCFKDYFETDSIHLESVFFIKNHLYKVQVQPNMLLDIPKEWESISDYTSALTKKYRSRYKSALKKAGNITKKELSLEAIDKGSETIYKLYKNVSDNAKVNSFILNDRHFYNLKKELGAQFKLFGYYLHEELVGFYTLILNDNQLETYFLGYNPEFQYKHQLYLNMLYDMLSFGIDNSFKTVVYARTAMEIKSSVGAVPKTMHIYMKHTNQWLLNPALKFIVKTLTPIKKWEERHPFK
ncbi:GNAT family N-acetyltransferase [Olleya sp. Bg11-27]|uniref:GNAT family N-acetyltransferase n=1 Tax=Olleya sp. Bg11-27 TaxID=2058135 RepID=UPI001E576109|nr:GNAT family N-acetyltransferase [Olleya sp. Bg11-27]